MYKQIRRVIAYYERILETDSPLEIAKHLKIQVHFCPLGNISGSYICIHRVKWIFINSDIEYDTYRQVVLAHELGHAVLHPEENCAFMAHSTLLLTSRIERQANLFAAELLIKDDLLKDYAGFTEEQFCNSTGYPIELLELKVKHYTRL